MIDAEAGSIECCRIREARNEWRKAITCFGTIRQREGIEIRLKGFGRVLSHAKRRDISRFNLRLAQSQTFIREKEEGVITPVVKLGDKKRPTECAPEIVLPQCRLWESV